MPRKQTVVPLKVALILGLLQAALAAGQGAHPVSGRRYAPVMGMGGAGWLERQEREEEERVELAVKLFELKPGMSVADVGAGVGTFSLKMALEVGNTGKVYATDIQAGMLDRLRERMGKAGLSNIVPVLSTATDAKLPVGALDLVLLVDVYHEFSHPREMMAGIRAALKENGRLVLLEYRKEDPAVPIREEHKMSIATVKQELEGEGFRLEKVVNDLPRQHMLVFTRRKVN
jgi:SAM-dependent methyltransferase